MTLTLQLPPEAEARLLAEAQVAGTSPDQWAAAALANLLAADEAEDAADRIAAAGAEAQLQADLSSGEKPIPWEQLKTESSR